MAYAAIGAAAELVDVKSGGISTRTKAGLAVAAGALGLLMILAMKGRSR